MGWGVRATSVDNVVLVEVVDSVKDLSDRLGGVLFRELALLANAVEQLATCGQLGNNIVFILAAVSPRARLWEAACSPSTRTSRGSEQCGGASSSATSPARRKPSVRFP
jgi:hypothetical protein